MHICESCENLIYGDDLVFDLSSVGIGWVCENCFREYISSCHPSFLDLDMSLKDMANELGVYCTDTLTYEEDQYNLYAEANSEDR